MKRFFYRAAIWLARIAAVLVVVLILFYAEEDWRGARDWAACQRELATKGESLDLRQLVPPGKPEDDLSKVPIFAELYQNKIDSNPVIDQITISFKIDYSKLYPKSTRYLDGEPLDLSSWQKYYRSIPETHLPEQIGTPAQDVLQALNQFEPQMKEVEAGLYNPNAYWPVDYEMPFATRLGGVTRMLRLSKYLQLRAIAELENKETDLAEKDYLFSFRINHPLAKRCLLIDYLVAAAVRNIDDAILWEGLRRHAWSDAQLHEMESSLASTDTLAFAVNSFRVERASFVKAVNVAQDVDTAVARRMKAKGFLFIFESALIRPSGWWDQDRLIYSQDLQNHIDAIDLGQGTLSSIAFPFYEMPDSGRPSAWDAFYTPLSTETLPGLDNTSLKIAKTETYRRLARLACRLEEYRIAHGQYPEALEALPDLPAHLNQEVLSEAPLRYSRKGDGYLLYSVGWDQKDDGGVLDPNHDDRKGDWVWPSP